MIYIAVLFQFVSSPRFFDVSSLLYLNYPIYYPDPGFLNLQELWNEMEYYMVHQGLNKLQGSNGLISDLKSSMVLSELIHFKFKLFAVTKIILWNTSDILDIPISYRTVEMNMKDTLCSGILLLTKLVKLIPKYMYSNN